MTKQQTIYFASSNKDKLKEIKSIWPLKKIEIKTASKNFKVNENGKTFISNAIKKAKTLSISKRAYAFADDSGIEVFALKRKPGIKSSRYFRNGKGMYEIIKKLKTKKHRKCCFTCAIAFTSPEGKVLYKIEKSWFGNIALKPKGKNGFGYDPIFIIPRLNKTSAEISPKLKNKISHRAMALKAFVSWLKKSYNKLTV